MFSIDLAKALLDALPVAVGGAVVTLIAVPLALRRFRAERVWEKKQEAYSRILESLFAVQIYFDTQLGHLETSQQLSKTVNERLEKELTRGQAEVRKQASVGALFISERAVEVLREVTRALDDPRHGEDLWDEFSAVLKAIDQALPELRAEARKDLGLMWRFSQSGRAAKKLLAEAEVRRHSVKIRT